MANKNVKKLLEESLSNIREDRKNASILLEDVLEHIGTSASHDKHREVGLQASKYLETLQRSNEQLVKIVSLIADSEEDEFGDLDKEDKEAIYQEFEEMAKNG